MKNKKNKRNFYFTKKSKHFDEFIKITKHFISTLNIVDFCELFIDNANSHIFDVYLCYKSKGKYNNIAYNHQYHIRYALDLLYYINTQKRTKITNKFYYYTNFDFTPVMHVSNSGQKLSKREHLDVLAEQIHLDLYNSKSIIYQAVYNNNFRDCVGILCKHYTKIMEEWDSTELLLKKMKKQNEYINVKKKVREAIRQQRLIEELNLIKRENKIKLDPKIVEYVRERVEICPFEEKNLLDNIYKHINIPYYKNYLGRVLLQLGYRKRITSILNTVTGKRKCVIIYNCRVKTTVHPFI